MAKVYLDDTTLTGIANQTRRLTNTEDSYTPSEMVTALSTVETGGANANIFVQLTQPETYWGIWISSDSFEYTNTVEINDKTQVQASSINIVKGNKYSTKILDNFTYYFKQIFLTDNNNNILENISIYYGNGSAWIEIKEYIPLEYVGSTGTQWVSTGVAGSNTISADIEFSITQATTWGCLMGCKVKADNGIGYVCGITNAGSLTGGWLGRSTTEQNFSGNSIMALNLKTKLESREKTMTFININGTKTFSCTPATEIYTTGDVHMAFFQNKVGTGTNTKDYASVRIYSCKIWDNNVLIRDFVPAKDDNNVACIYDKLHGIFYYNQGTGNLEAGSIIN